MSRLLEPPEGRQVFRLTFEPQPADIDANGHVNNVVYLRWAQDLGVAHWQSLAPPEALTTWAWVNIASYRVKPGDVVSVRERSRNMALVLEALQSGERDTPDYITVDMKGMSATFVRAPDLAEVPYPVKMEPNLVIEFYAS